MTLNAGECSSVASAIVDVAKTLESVMLPRINSPQGESKSP